LGWRIPKRDRKIEEWARRSITRQDERSFLLLEEIYGIGKRQGRIDLGGNPYVVMGMGPIG